MRDELFDVLDGNGRPTGATVPRDEAHRAGIWHGAFHCLIVYPREGMGQALFQLRASEKKIAPGKFDVSVGGHYAAGEDAVAAGPREIAEELGLTVRFQDLTPLGRRIYVCSFGPDLQECEFQDVFFLALPGHPHSLHLQESEVEAVLELPIQDGIDLFAARRNAVAGRLTTRAGIEEMRTVAADAFVPCQDRYYLKLLLLAKRFFEGERALLQI